MVKSWLAYLLTLLCGVAFYLFYPKPLSFYTLILLLALPYSLWASPGFPCAAFG